MANLPRPSAATKRRAFVESGNRCPFPGCSTTLITTDGGYLGEICFIEAAAPGGPRYNPEQTAEERASIDNLIVLCATHHRMVDVHPGMYTAEWLRDLKGNKGHQGGRPSTSSAPTAALALSLLLGAKPLRTLQEALAFWQKHKSNADEEFWQKFLNTNPHVLAYALPDCVIKLEQKAYVGGKAVDNRGGNLLDFLFASKATRNVVLIEIKTPRTPLLGKQYRGNAYSMSDELTGAIVQVLNYREELLKSYYALRAASTKPFEAIAPRCYVLAGSVEREGFDETQGRSFELFRGSQEVTILTYDELFAKLADIADLGSS